MKPVEVHLMGSVSLRPPSVYLEVEVGTGIQDAAEKAFPVVCPIHFA